MALRGKHAWHIRARTRAIRAYGQGKGRKKRIGAVKDKAPTPVGPVDKCVLSELGVLQGLQKTILSNI